MHTTALTVATLVSVGIILIGARFLLAPRQATLGFGVTAEDVRALTAIKGGRDIAFGTVMFAVWAAAGPAALGWALVAAALAPVADAAIVLARGGKPAVAFGVHGLTAALMVAAGLVLALG